MRSPLRAWKLVLAFLSCLCAFYVTVQHTNGGRGFGFRAPSPALAQASRSSSGRHVPDPNYDLTRMDALRFTIVEINSSYVDPSRVHPREMLLKGLEAIQRQVAQVLVRHDENANTVSVRVDTDERTFQLADVDSPWSLTARWGDIFGFLQQKLHGVPDVDLQEVEYAAANGMLRTLDPHSTLLSPEAFHEMQIQTGGHFGGLGIVISIRDGLLTVMNPMPNTPASRAGLHRFDRIVQIDNESTLNMTLQEAVNRLRGDEGSNVNVMTTRAGPGGWTVPRRVTLTRAVISVDSVESRMLANGVGYAKIKSFSEDTSEELHHALERLHAQNMRSLVLDMRGNPGGLLEQAVEVADTFLRSGTIVVTAGNRTEGRDERTAQERGTEPNYPLLVLIDGGSASASEIVAGALKGNNRALIVGQQSFGKGSVQTIRTLRDHGALKITIAQYLTPGDVSIQGVGITPDIELDPMTVDALEMDLEADKAFLRESDLSAHLTSNRAREAGHAQETVRYFFSQDDRERLRERGPDDLGDEGWHEDFPIRFARDVLAADNRGGRTEELQDARAAIEHARAGEIELVSRALGALPQHIDWAEGTDEGASDLAVTMQTTQPVAVPGSPYDLTVTVTNRGAHPVFRLRANTKSDNPLFENRELVFGRINPGETRTWTAPLGLCMVEGHRPGTTTPPPPGAQRTCTVPRASLSRVDGIRLEWDEAHGHTPHDVAPIRASIQGLERPVYGYGWQVADNVRGNGDGRVQRGEEVTLYLTVHNTGRGRGFATKLNLKNLAGQGVLLHAGRFEVPSIAPDGEQQVAFTFEVQPDFRESEVKLELQIEDEDLREFVTQKIHVPIADGAGGVVQPASGAWAPGAETAVYESPAADARPVARVPAGASLAVSARAGEFVRVDLGGSRPAWARRSEGSAMRGAGRPALAYVLHNSPPLVESDAGANLAVRDGVLHVTGHATDQQRVLDVYVFVGARKVFYRSNRNGQDPRSVAFTADLPLRPGSNVVTIVAREDDDTLARRTYVVRRDGPDGQLLQTPRQGQDDDDEE